jgi:hypothetical protein
VVVSMTRMSRSSMSSSGFVGVGAADADVVEAAGAA